VEELRDPGPGDAHPVCEGSLGQVRVGVELGAESTSLLEQDLDGGRAERPGALGVEGLRILLAQKGLAAVGQAPDTERKDVVEARSVLISVGFGEPVLP